MIDCLKEREKIDWTCPYMECRRTITKKYWESILGFNRRVIKHLKRHYRNDTGISQKDQKTLWRDNYGI